MARGFQIGTTGSCQEGLSEGDARTLLCMNAGDVLTIGAEVQLTTEVPVKVDCRGL